MGSDLFGDFVAARDAYLVRRLREAGFVIVGKTSMPEMGILPTTEPRRFGPDPEPLGHRPNPGRVERRRGGGGRRRHGSGRARQRRRRLDPDPRRVLRAGRSEAGARAGVGRPGRRRELPGLRRRADPLGAGHGARARRPRRPRARRRHVGPAAPGRRLRGVDGGRPRPAADRLHRSLPPLEERDGRPDVASGRHETPRRCSSRSATTSRRSRHRGRASTCCRTSPARSRRRCRSPSGWAASSRGREPTADDVEPLTWMLWERRPGLRTRSSTWQRRAGSSRSRARWCRNWRSYDVGAHAGARAAPGADRRDQRTRARPDGQLPPVGPFHAVHRDLQRHRPAGDLAAALPGRGRPADSPCS